MDNLGWFIYFIGVADGFKSFFIISGTLCLILFLIATILVICVSTQSYMDEQDKSIVNLFKKHGAKTFAGLFLFISLGIAIPSSKTLAAMYLIPAIVNNEDISALAKDSIKGLRLLSAEWLKSLVEDKEK